MFGQLHALHRDNYSLLIPSTFLIARSTTIFGEYSIATPLLLTFNITTPNLSFLLAENEQLPTLSGQPTTSIFNNLSNFINNLASMQPISCWSTQVFSLGCRNLKYSNICIHFAFSSHWTVITASIPFFLKMSTIELKVGVVSYILGGIMLRVVRYHLLE